MAQDQLPHFIVTLTQHSFFVCSQVLCAFVASVARLELCANELKYNRFKKKAADKNEILLQYFEENRDPKKTEFKKNKKFNYTINIMDRFRHFLFMPDVGTFLSFIFYQFVCVCAFFTSLINQSSQMGYD